MYQHFYGLQALPFELTPNPKYLLLTPTHREALHMLEYGVGARKGIILLIGDAGTGKTTLLRRALALRLEQNGAAGADCIYIKNPRLAPRELYEHLGTGLSLRTPATASRPAFLRELEDVLVASAASRRATALIVDEAQALSDEILEELRLLANIESDDIKLLPLVLAGQPELAERLNHPDLRQFKQRIALRCRLNAFNLQDTGAYIFGRLRLVGGDASKLFTREAVVAIHHASHGIPRTISVICDNALLTGYALQRRLIDAAIIDEVCADFDLLTADGTGRRTDITNDDNNVADAMRVRRDAGSPADAVRLGVGVHVSRSAV